MLKLKNVEAKYGNIKAIRGINLEVNKGEIVALLGSNGAGKSTTMMTICGKPRASKGQIFFEGEEITNLKTHQISRLGISQSPEGRRIFSHMTVFENLQMGAICADKKNFNKNLEHIVELFPIIKARLKQPGGTLSGGEQQMLSLSRAIMSDPKILMLDEPSLGLAPLIIKRIFDSIKKLNEETGITIFLVEQNVNMSLKLSSRAYVLKHGEISHSSSSEKLLNDNTLLESYL